MGVVYSLIYIQQQKTAQIRDLKKIVARTIPRSSQYLDGQLENSGLIQWQAIKYVS